MCAGLGERERHDRPLISLGNVSLVKSKVVIATAVCGSSSNGSAALQYTSVGLLGVDLVIFTSQYHLYPHV